ncbi:MAG: PKD domain-containing protein, partial [Thermoplasmata archaeon]|nr:PKD domain-containing protein [Thermoplasmata archaeon]
TINYFLEYKNIGLKSAINTEIVMVLPINTTYKSNTGGGTYNSTTHEVLWRFNISAKSRGHLSVKCKVNWGLSWGTKLVCNGSIRNYITNTTLATDSFISLVTPARDPNINYGPEGNVASWQKLNYTIEFENEGTGIAFGVYFTDELSEYLDDSTLKIGPVIGISDGSLIAPAGIYNPSTRTITWLVGEVGSGSGGYANISINVRADASPGTEIINYGTVYFPSVPEITRTNGIVSIVIANQGPKAIAGKNMIAQTLQNIIFNGSSSFDPDGVITSYAWDFGDGVIGYGKIVTHSYLDDGNYTVTLSVKDDKGGSDSQTISVKVLNRPPIANLEVDSKDIPSKEVIFNATASLDLDGIVSEYYFDYGDGINSGWVQTPIINHKYSEGTKIFTVNLKVRDV